MIRFRPSVCLSAGNLSVDRPIIHQSTLFFAARSSQLAAEQREAVLFARSPGPNKPNQTKNSPQLTQFSPKLSTSTSTDNRTQMIKLCQLRKQGQFRMDQSAGQQQQQQQQQTFLPRSAVHSLGAAPARQQQFGRSGAAVIMPATQQPARTGQLAMRAKLSPAMSLFNRLDGFVLQLESSRDFFAHWPDQICHRIRSPAKITSSSNEQQQQRTTTIMNANQLAGESEVGSQQQQQPQNGSSAVCWTGQNFGR